jgi:outer membrane lipopolysaccharide assembly protein LptE/RlpB
MKRLFLLLFCTSLLSLAGCSYHLVGQGSLPEHIKTIAIPIFENKTLETGAEDAITQAVSDRFVNGGKVRLVSEGEADAILRGKIRSYNAKEVVTYDASGDPTSYKLTVAIDVELQDLTTNEVLWKTENLSENADFKVEPGENISLQESAEAEALQTVAKALADRVWALSTEGF